MTIGNPETEWVAGRLAALDPPADWQPDPRAARKRFAVRSQRIAPWAIWACRTAAVTAVVATILAAVPPVRLAAQRAWQVLFAREVSILRVDVDSVPDAVWTALRGPDFTWRFEATSVQGGPTEASRLAGFAVRLPGTNLMPGTPFLALVTPMTGELVLRVDALERAAQSTGVSDFVVPPEWEGAQMRVATGPLVMADYAGTALLQTTPVAITVPSGFALQAFAEFALRLLGFDPAEASALAMNASVAPMAFFGIPKRAHVTVTQVPLRSGMATMIRDLDESQDGARVTLIWSRADRIYLLTGPIPDDVALAVAESLK